MGSDTGTKLGLIAIAISVVAALIAYANFRQAQKARRLVVLAEFLKEYRLIQPERRRVNRRFPDLQPIAFCGLSELPGELERDAIVVCYYLDHLSLLVEKGLVEEKDIMQDPRWID